tara:strand:+ start:10606 stop:11130 length:525 start_codon:yes stop_codon:yes gene_type:complete
MPNWCANRVTVSGNEEDVQAFKEAVQGHVVNNEKPFSFNAIIPMPDELRGIGSPVKIVHTEEEIEEYKKQHSDSEWAIGNLPITCKRSEELRNKYGSDNWYDWCNDNWTCKWDACDVYLDVDEPDYLQYRFDTAWGPPENIYHVLKLQHPDVYISWFYDEPGMQFAGYLNKDEQ